jgi:hypothetical protein
MITFFIAVLVFVPSVYGEDPPLFDLRNYMYYEKPNAQLFKVVADTIKKQQTRIYPNQKCMVHEDFSKGTIQGDWCLTHKGEVLELIQAHVVGNLYQIDVWHKSNWPFSTPYKGLHSKLSEFMIQKEIKEKIESSPNKANSTDAKSRAADLQR